MKPIRIATRESQLALIQAEQIAASLNAQGYQTEIIGMTTTGDRILDKTLTEIGGKGIFTKEIDQAVLDGRADISVHSLKDMPTDDEDGLILAAVPKRESDKDIMLLSAIKYPPAQQNVNSSQYSDEIINAEFSAGCGSPRRTAQLAAITQKLHPIRGNIQTRINKIHEHGWDGLVMAKAAYNRLQLHQKHLYIELNILPAAGQGAIGVRCAKNDTKMQVILNKINDKASRIQIEAERNFLKTLDGGCHVPAGIKTIIEENELHLNAAIFSENGNCLKTAKLSGKTSNAAELGKDLALILKHRKIT